MKKCERESTYKMLKSNTVTKKRVIELSKNTKTQVTLDFESHKNDKEQRTNGRVRVRFF